MKDVKRLFGMRMKELRKNRWLSQEELAEKAGISSKYLSRVEMGQHLPSIDVLARLADILHVEIKDLFDFGHEVGLKELRETMNKFTKELDEEKLRMAVKLLRALVR